MVQIGRFKNSIFFCGEDETGFTACRSYMYTLEKLLQIKQAEDKDILKTFVDMRKDLIEATKNLYTQNVMFIKMEMRIIGNFNTTNGLLKCCSTPPTVFNIY